MSKKRNKFDAIKEQQSVNISATEMDQATYGGRNKELDALFGGATQKRNKQQSDILEVNADGIYSYGRVGLTSVGLDIPSDVSIEEYSDLGRLLLDVGSRIQWLIGDWIVFGDQFEWGHTYEKLAEEFGFEPKSLREYAYVCRNVDLSIRMDKLTFGHHQVVAGMPAEEQSTWLQLAVNGDNGQRWSIKRLREEIRASRDYLPAPKSALDKLADSLNKFLGNIQDNQRHLAAALLRQAADELEGKK